VFYSVYGYVEKRASRAIRIVYSGAAGDSLKVGGTLAGHDWNTYGSVQEAVKSMLGQNFSVEGNCWIHLTGNQG
jgi:hypothetical protein